MHNTFFRFKRKQIIIWRNNYLIIISTKNHFVQRINLQISYIVSIFNLNWIFGTKVMIILAHFLHWKLRNIISLTSEYHVSDFGISYPCLRNIICSKIIFSRYYISDFGISCLRYIISLISEYHTTKASEYHISEEFWLFHLN